MFHVSIKRKKKTIISRLIRTFSGPNPELELGFPAGEVDSDIIQRAVWNEFGTRGGASGGGWGGPIPERPFLRNALRANEGKYKNAIRSSAAKILRGETTPITTLRKIGIVAVGDIQSEITSLSSPPNSPVTISLKGSSNPLIDSGEMRAAVTFKIHE